MPQDKFLQQISLDRSLKTDTGTRYLHPGKESPIKNITWNTRQVKMREQPVGIHRHALQTVTLRIKVSTRTSIVDFPALKREVFPSFSSP